MYSCSLRQWYPNKVSSKMESTCVDARRGKMKLTWPTSRLEQVESMSLLTAASWYLENEMS